AAGVMRPIVVFSPLTAGGLDVAAQHRLTVGVSDLASLERWCFLAARAGPLSFHLEIDTGMGRAGFDWRETAVWAEQVRAFCNVSLRWEGVYTHFQSADAPDRAPTFTQWERFQGALSQL